MRSVADKAWRLINAAINTAQHPSAKCNVECVELHFDGYSEPGYDGEIIATGNWNSIGDKYNQDSRKFEGGDYTLPRLSRALDKIGVQIEWSDEWVRCDDCGGLVRTSPNSYGWMPSYVMVDGCEIICHECIKPEEHLRSLENKPNRCNTIDKIDPADYGYVKVGEYQHGFYPGQTDDPKQITSQLEQQGHKFILFHMDNVGQFDQHFSAWVRSDDSE